MDVPGNNERPGGASYIMSHRQKLKVVLAAPFQPPNMGEELTASRRASLPKHGEGQGGADAINQLNLTPMGRHVCRPYREEGSTGGGVWGAVNVEGG